jgi:hypothetical protein
MPGMKSSSHLQQFFFKKGGFIQKLQLQMKIQSKKRNRKRKEEDHPICTKIQATVQCSVHVNVDVNVGATVDERRISLSLNILSEVGGKEINEKGEEGKQSDISCVTCRGF